MKLGPEDVSLLERCPHFRGWYVQASMELGPEDVSLSERYPHFRLERCPRSFSDVGMCPHNYVYISLELIPEDVSLLERCLGGVRTAGCFHPPYLKGHRVITSLIW